MTEIQYWVTFPSRFSKDEKIHRSGCRYSAAGNGRWLTDAQLKPFEMLNCKVCGGRYE
jgi:hypothetical protein